MRSMLAATFREESAAGAVAAAHPRPSYDAWLLAGVLLVSIVLPLCLYAHTASVTEDGATFIHYARQLGGEVPRPETTLVHDRRGAGARAILDRLCRGWPALASVEAEEQHPGYPLLILCVQRTVGPWLAADPVMQWTRAAQLASLLSGCLLTLAIFLHCRRLFGTTAGLAVALLSATLPALVCQRVEALSDAPALALLTLSALYAVRLLEDGSGRAALLCGLFGGLGYLFRPEAIQITLLTGFVLLWRSVRRPPGEYGQMLLLALPVLACCGPYMFLRGVVLTKSAGIVAEQGVTPSLPHAAQQVQFQRGGSGQKPLLIIDERVLLLARGIKRFLMGWLSNLGYALSCLLIVGVLARGRDIRGREGRALIWSAVLLNLVLLAGVLYAVRGYLDPRHVLSVTVLTMPWIWPGLIRVATVVHRLLLRGGHLAGLTAPRLAPGLTIVLACVLGLSVIPRTLHSERNGYRLAGEWLRERVPPGRSVVDPESLVSLYAGLDGRNLWERDHLELSTAYLDGLLGRQPGVAYLIYSDRYLRDHGLPEGMPAQTGHYRLREVQSFAASLDPSYLRRVRVWSVERFPEGRDILP